MPGKTKTPVRLSRPPLERMMFIHGELKRGALTNCSKLARRLEVSPKTVMRDLAFMRDRLDLPVEYDARLYAFRYTYPVESFPTVQITAGELLALLVAGKALEQYQGTPYHRQLRLSFEKLAGSARNLVSFQPSDGLAAISFHNLGLGAADLKVFEALSRAVLERFAVEFDYRKPQDETPSRRRVRPYHLANRENFWYLIGLDEDRGGIRSFALPRLNRLEITRRRFDRPEGFSPEAFFGKAFGAFVGTGDHRVRIRFDAFAAGRVRERLWHDSQEFEPTTDGGLELTLRLGDLEEVERWILSWGAHAEALAPKELIRRLGAVAERLSHRYRGRG